MSYEVTGRRRPTKAKKQIRQQKKGRDDVDVTKLQKAVEELVRLGISSACNISCFAQQTDLTSRTPKLAIPNLLISHFPNLPRLA